jgi:EAL domain-containing protein (putative c-di-GMP-specific phosphodiesterase class I)
MEADDLAEEAASLFGRIEPPSRRRALLQLMQALAEQDAASSGLAEDQALLLPPPPRVRQDDQALSEELRQAILEPGTGLSLRYQPMVDARDGRLLGFEALLRWTTPNGLVIPPERVFAIATAHGLEEALEFWVLQEALMRSANWLLQQPGLTLSVNVAGALLANTLGLAMIRALLRSTGIPPASLCLEVTETMLLDEASRTNLSAIKALGLKVAIDDFGTGQSSLARLLDLDVDVVKLDRSFFVGRDGGREGDLSFLRAIVRMAHSRNATVVAEGIARSQDEALARRAGCDACQGFWYAQALSAEGTADMARETRQPWQRARTAGSP